MNLDLFILRHAIAVERGTKGYENDSERPLTPEGDEKLRQVAKALRRLICSLANLRLLAGDELVNIILQHYIRGRRVL